MKVKFNNPDEFLAELDIDAPIQPILRVTRVYRRDTASASIGFVSVAATYVNARNEIVEFTHYCGEDWGGEFEMTKLTAKAAQDLIDRISRHAAGKGVTVRPGTYAAD